MSKVKKMVKESSKIQITPFKDSWDRKNFLILFMGIGLLILGYFLMTLSPWNNPVALTISPVIIIVAYLIIIPIAILVKSSTKKKNVSSEG